MVERSQKLPKGQGKTEREEFQAIYFQNKKIGYIKSLYTPQADGALAIDQQAHMQLNISGATHPIDLRLQARVNNTGRLQDFVFSFHFPFYQNYVSATIAFLGLSLIVPEQ